MVDSIDASHEHVFSAVAWSEVVKAEPSTRVLLGGRLSNLRRHRRTVFADLSSGGASIQVAFGPDNAEDLEPGHVVVVDGELGASRTGTKTLFVKSIPARRRVAGVLTTDREVMEAQSSLLEYLRSVMSRLQFGELHTAYLSRNFEGGGALPFTTLFAHRQETLYLRVTAEPALLSAVAAGAARCYELAASFRNERRDRQHRPEFGLLEAYASDMTYDEVTDLAVELCSWRLENCAPLTLTFPEACALACVEEPPSADPSNQQLLLKSIGPRLPGIAVVERLPFPSSPLISGSGAEAGRRWIFVNGAFCCEVARNEIDPDALAMKLARQRADDRHSVDRNPDRLLAIVAGLPPTSGLGAGTTRLLEAHGHLVGTSGYLI